MVGQRRRRANICPALGQRLLFERLHDTKLWREIDGRQTHSTEDSQDGLSRRADEGKPKCPHLSVRGET